MGSETLQPNPEVLMQPVAAVSRQRCECMSSQGRTRSKLVFLKNLRERISIHFSQISQLSFLFEPVIWKEMTRRKCQPLERFPGAVRAEWTHKIKPDVTSSSFTSTLNMLLNTSAAGYFIHLWLSSVRGWSGRCGWQRTLTATYFTTVCRILIYSLCGTH